MRKLLLIACVILFIGGLSWAQDLAYFEKTYKIKLSGIKAREEYPDPDQYYNEIAKQTGILDVLKNEVAERDQWKAEKAVKIISIIRRGPQNIWTAVIFRLTEFDEAGKPRFEGAEERWIQINDQKEVIYYGSVKPMVGK